MSSAGLTCPPAPVEDCVCPPVPPAAWLRGWRRLLGRWRDRPATAHGLALRLRDDIGLDPPAPGSDGRQGGDFSRYFQYY